MHMAAEKMGETIPSTDQIAQFLAVKESQAIKPWHADVAWRMVQENKERPFVR